MLPGRRGDQGKSSSVAALEHGLQERCLLKKEFCCFFDTGGAFANQINFAFPTCSQSGDDLVLTGDDSTGRKIKSIDVRCLFFHGCHKP